MRSASLFFNLSRISAVAAAIVLSGCGKDDDSDDADVAKSDLEGTWSQACGTDGAVTDESTWDVGTNVYSGSTLTISSDSYSDAGCANRLLSFRAVATFKSGGSATAPAGAKNLDVKPTGVFVTLSNADYVAGFNGTSEGSTAVCGGGFVINVEKQLTNALCASDESFKTIENESFDVYKIDGTTLAFGAAGDDGTATDGSTAAKRPTTLETRVFMKK